MDKKQLNLEIILCRPLVKKAKVCVVRKLLKQVKILRSCKNEASKEKKLRKAKRLIAEIHAVKTLRADYVTKFLLVTENYVFAGSNTKLKRKRNSCAKLAKHSDLMAKINAIRNKFVNWREQLPPMLKSVKKKVKEDVVNDSRTENDEVDESSEEDSDENNVNLSEGEVEEEEKWENEDLISDGKVKECPIAEEELNSECGNDSKSGSHKPKMGESLPALNTPKIDFVKTKMKTRVKQGKKIEREGAGSVKRKMENVSEEAEECSKETGNGNCETEKMEDPFFIGKKVIVPLLLQKGNESHVEMEKMRRRGLSEDIERDFRPKKRRNVIDKSEGITDERMGKRTVKSDLRKKVLTEEDLHPSWKAKKMQTLKPFQGKKIVFD